MHIVILPDSYKGSLSSMQVADALEAGFLAIWPDAACHKLAIADGGEGTVDALLSAKEGVRRTVKVQGPLGTPVQAEYGLFADGTAIIEMAAASGLPLLAKEERDPLRASTFGTGQLLLDALEQGCTRIMMGIGGSATNDGGTGMARALGARFLDKEGNELAPGGAALINLAKVDVSGLDERLAKTDITLLSDVTNPLCGENGASHVFGPQKGADAAGVKQLDAALAHYAKVVLQDTGKDLVAQPGAGAAGGLGFGMMAFAGAKAQKGIEAILDAIEADKYLQKADLVVTGEGRMDGQTVNGKAAMGVALRAKKYGKPVLAVVGSIGEGADAVYAHGIDAIISIPDAPMPLEHALKNSAPLVRQAAARAARMMNIGKTL